MAGSCRKNTPGHPAAACGCAGGGGTPCVGTSIGVVQVNGCGGGGIPGASVTISFGGTAVASGSTDATGKYTFAVPFAATFTIVVVAYGYDTKTFTWGFVCGTPPGNSTLATMVVSAGSFCCFDRVFQVADLNMTYNCGTLVLVQQLNPVSGLPDCNWLGSVGTPGSPTPLTCPQASFPAYSYVSFLFHYAGSGNFQMFVNSSFVSSGLTCGIGTGNLFGGYGAILVNITAADFFNYVSAGCYVGAPFPPDPMTVSS
jgi:hypothetical protein